MKSVIKMKRLASLSLFIAVLIIGAMLMPAALAQDETAGEAPPAEFATLTPDEIEILDVSGAAASANPTTPGGVAQYRVTFKTTNELQANFGIITIRFDKDATVPATIDRNRIVVTASDLSGAAGGSPGQAVALTQDPIVSPLIGGEGEMEVGLIVPDMDPSTTAGAGSGIQNIAAGAVVTVTISSGAGVRNPTEGGGVEVWVFTSLETNPVFAPGVAIPRVLAISASDGGRGSNVTMNGKGFKDGTTATVWLDTNNNGVRDPGEIDIASTLVSTGDTFTAPLSITVPPFIPGPNRIMARDGRNNHASAPVFFNLLGSVQAVPSTLSRGETFTITLYDFPPSTAVPANAANLGGLALPIPGTIYPPTGVLVPGFQPATDHSGHVSFMTTVPEGVPLGVQTLQVNFAGSGTRRTNLTIVNVTWMIQGHAFRQSQAEHGGILLRLNTGEETFTQSDGSFAFGDLEEGEYTVTVSAPYHLPATRSGIVLAAGEVVALPPVTLRWGDANGDGAIDAADLALLAGNLEAVASDW